MREVASGLRYPSGPIAMDDGSLLVVEIEGGNLTRIEPEGTTRVVAVCGGGPNGAAIGPDGAAYVCNNGGLEFRTEDEIRFPQALVPGNTGGYVQRVDLAGGTVDVLYTHAGDERLASLNDIVFDARGWFYFVDTTAGAVYYANPDGSEIRPVATALAFPNGIDLAADGGRLFVSETYSGRLLTWPVGEVGDLGSVALLYSSGDAHGWDGLAVDDAGNICGANLQESGVTAVTPDGRVAFSVTVPRPDSHVTNICFGGDDRRTAFITSSGRGTVYAMDWPADA